MSPRTDPAEFGIDPNSSGADGSDAVPDSPSNQPSPRGDTVTSDDSVSLTDGDASGNKKLDKITLWLRRADQLLLGTILISLIILLAAYRWKLSGGGQGEIEIISQRPREYFYSIDVNRASWVEWAQLDGIGEKLARRIVQDRLERGDFKSIDDVGRVKNVGPKLIEKLRPFLKCADDDFTEPH